MAHLITGLFPDSKAAGEAVAELKSKGFTDEISLIAKDENTGEVNTHTVEESGEEGATAGAAVGAAIGGVAALVAGLTIAPLGVGLLVAGPLATALSGAAVGAVAGGAVGLLVDKGIPDDTAQIYENRISSGEVLVAIQVDHDREEEVKDILNNYHATDISEGHKDL